MMPKLAVFLHGPIGTGKTTLGRALAERLSGGFIDGDDFSDPARPWYCSILQTSRSIVETGLKMLDGGKLVVIAYPLDCMGWIYFSRKFADARVTPLFVGLRASYAAIVDDRRGRVFSAQEHERIKAMIAQGYDARPFSDLVVDTGGADFTRTLATLESAIQNATAPPAAGCD